jgi:hypothetical protein
MKYFVSVIAVSLIVCGCRSADKFQPTWLSDPSQVVYSSQYDGKILVRVKAKVPEAEFVSAIKKLNMVPIAEDKEFAATAEALRWKRGPDRKWDPLPGLENTFLCHRLDLWETAKYENGFLYYQVLNLEK